MSSEYNAPSDPGDRARQKIDEATLSGQFAVKEGDNQVPESTTLAGLGSEQTVMGVTEVVRSTLRFNTS